MSAAPADEAVIEAFRDIFDRRYFANHGPLVQALDQAFAQALGVRHAVCVVNGTVALMVALEALLLRARAGEHRHRPAEVIVSALAPPTTLQAIRWAGGRPVLCDVDPVSLGLAPEAVEALVGADTAGVVATHRWGVVAHVDELEALAARRGLLLLFDSAEAMGCAVGRRAVGGFGQAEAFSLRSSNLVQALDGGLVTTDDDGLADDLRTIRSFHAQETFSAAPLRMNAKMSEAQAAMGLLSLADLPRNRDANRRRHALYRRALKGVAGLSLAASRGADMSSHQDIVARIEPSAPVDRDRIEAHLRAAGVPARRPGPFAFETVGAQRSAMPVAEHASRRLLQLPNGQELNDDDIHRTCALLRQVLSA